jgi:predicted  nucleic acid-binding Zn-ribbon protein
MSDNVTNELIYETLKRMQETLSLHSQYHLETKERLGFIEQQYASISRRIDRIDERLERVERRLDLVEV